MKSDLAVGEQLLQMPELDIDDLLHLVAPEPIEQNDLVQPVDEFRPERAAHDLHHLVACRLGRLAFQESGEIFRAEI
jgi:hypothetical protein